MPMIRSGFLSSTDRLELQACVRRQRKDHGIARCANAILLLDDGKSCQEISDFLYLDDDTIQGWYKTFLQMVGMPFFRWLERRSVPYDAGTGNCFMGLDGSTLLSLDGRDQGPCRS